LPFSLSRFAEFRTPEASVPALRLLVSMLPMLEETSWVPRVASCAFRAISSVAEPCCSTAAAIAVAVSLTALMVCAIPWIDCAEDSVASWIALTWPAISSVAYAV
jgi:hypothetical protein